MALPNFRVARHVATGTDQWSRPRLKVESSARHVAAKWARSVCNLFPCPAERQGASALPGPRPGPLQQTRHASLEQPRSERRCKVGAPRTTQNARDWHLASSPHLEPRRVSVVCASNACDEDSRHGQASAFGQGGRHVNSPLLLFPALIRSGEPLVPRAQHEVADHIGNSTRALARHNSRRKRR